jgi:hypothetical protein
MPFTDRCWTPRPAVLAAAMILFSACERVGSDVPPGACPPVIEYSPEEQAGVANEVALLPEGTLIVGWLADYAVLRNQARTCR